MKQRANLLIASAAGLLLVLLFWQLVNVGVQEEVAPPPTEKVGMILNGSAQDRGFRQALYEAASAVCSERGLQFTCFDGVQAGESFRHLTEQLIQDGNSLILCDSEAYDQDLTSLAQRHPTVCFLNAMGTVKGHNLSSCMRRTYQARYLTGIVAGLQTETNEVGYIVSSLTLETIRQLNAFTLGVRRANPYAQVFVRCTEGRNDEEKVASVTDALLNAHRIDVVSCHDVPVSALAAADARGVWTIGYQIDAENPFPNTWLTGYAFDWKPFYHQRVEEWQENRFVGKQYRGGIRSGLVSLAPLSDLVKKGTKEVVEREMQKMLDGTFDVFFGPVSDDQGVLRIREGETIPDETILHGMDWYVDGVVVE